MSTLLLCYVTDCPRCGEQSTYCNDDIAVTYEDKLLELIRGGALQMDASAMQDKPPIEHAA